MHNEWQDLRLPEERLRWARESAGFEEATEAATALGVPAPTYLAHENGSRGFARTAARYAEFFRVSLDWLLTRRGSPRAGMRRGNATTTISSATPYPEGVRIVGAVGAGPEGSIQFSTGEQNLDTAPFPPGWTENTVALEVRGNSMRPIAYDGWLVYYDARRGGITPEMVGQPCVIELASGHTVVKTPQLGSKRGLFNLESANPTVDTMRDQKIKWAALVTAFIPRSSARRLYKDASGRAAL